MADTDDTTAPDAIGHRRFALIEASIDELRAALDAGATSSVELATLYLNRIAHYDRHGICLNAVPVLNPQLFAEARAADERRARGATRGRLDGIPYLAKDSYAVAGLTVASGSPAFEHLVAQRDAFVIARLRAAGAVLIGLTNMPPMAAGGMQRGVYGRAESPYNGDFLAAAFASGSSNGSGTGVAASFASFGLAEETWSSGRAPAANGGLVAYTPSRGVISVRGNWPLIPTMDVVVPYARTVSDLFEILNVIVADDDETRGDFWRTQTSVSLPRASATRPADYRELADARALNGMRIGVPRMYINQDGASRRPIVTRASVIALWEAAARDLRALGAEVVEVDFPLVSNYECDRPGTQSMTERGWMPAEYAAAEGDLIAHAWHDYLVANGDPALKSLGDVDGRQIIPSNPSALRDRYEGLPDFRRFPERIREGLPSPYDSAALAAGLRALEQARAVDLEAWMDAQSLDALVFPAVADIAPADADVNPLSQDVAWRNGTWVANGNQAIRHCGVPTVTVTMGMLPDIRMPAGLTFAGRAYDDQRLLAFAYAYESSAARRVAPPRTPPLPGESFTWQSAANVVAAPAATDLRLTFTATLSPVADDGTVTLTVRGEVAAETALEALQVFVNGVAVAARRCGPHFSTEIVMSAAVHTALHSRWRGPYGSIVVVIVQDTCGVAAAEYAVVGGVG